PDLIRYSAKGLPSALIVTPAGVCSTVTSAARGRRVARNRVNPASNTSGRGIGAFSSVEGGNAPIVTRRNAGDHRPVEAASCSFSDTAGCRVYFLLTLSCLNSVKVTVL